jgi:hypothetical protein
VAKAQVKDGEEQLFFTFFFTILQLMIGAAFGVKR